MNEPAVTKEPDDIDEPQASQHALPSGRSVTVRIGDQGETIDIRSPVGEVELTITLTEKGPVIQLSAADLQLRASDNIEVKCRRFEVHSTEATDLTTDGDVNIAAQGNLKIDTKEDTHVNGKMIYLNC